MIDLKAKPFNLSDEQIQWVEETISKMTLEQKIGQLFFHNESQRDEAAMLEKCQKYGIGGLRWTGGTLEDVYNQNKFYQEHSEIPMLIASNVEKGGDGVNSAGTLIAPGPAAAACATTEAAYNMGYVSGVEGVPVGANVAFAPVVDVIMDWRNTVINNRAFSSDVDKTIRLAKAYMDGLHQSNVIACAKHFPGDGSNERDHHLLTETNDLSVEEWDNTYGRVYKELIEYGLEAMMVGHIRLPAYSREFIPEITDEQLMPASLSHELVTNLLRETLGFNGLVITDSSRMAGLRASCPRSQQVPGAIAAGCDMFLYFSDVEEDFNFMLQGYTDGIITDERLHDALYRILGTKAHLELNEFTFPRDDGLSVVGSEAHHALAAKAADESITLVKDTQGILPIDPTEKKRARVYFLESTPIRLAAGTDSAKPIVVQELERAGFEVDLWKNLYDLELENSSPDNISNSMLTGSVAEFKANYDVVFVFVNMDTYAQENTVRIRYSLEHSVEIPWYVHEVPTVCVSLNYTNHLIDMPDYKTFINAYASTEEYIRAAIEKITGKSDFKGEFEDLVWCGRWETKL
ncbi:MAG: glycoside hydrolase family 3 protein [Lachnospiraceae bacterium]